MAVFKASDEKAYLRGQLSAGLVFTGEPIGQRRYLNTELYIYWVY